MATSGVAVFRLNRDQIITQALLKVGGIDPESTGTITATQMSNAAVNLNLMVKALEEQGGQLWEQKYGVIFPQKNQGVYVFGNPGKSLVGDHTTLVSDNLFGYGGFVKTTLSANATSGASTVTLTSLSSPSSPGIAAVTAVSGYNVGIELNTGALHWTTINGAPSGTTITLTDNLPSAASSGNIVYCYQTQIIRPLRITDCFYRQASGDDIPIRLISKEEYNRFGLKTSNGTTVQAYYDPQLEKGFLHVYPVPTDVTSQIYIEFQKPIEDFVSSSDDYDFPQEWGEALVWGLAMRLIPDYMVPMDRAKLIISFAEQFLSKITAWDREPTSIYFKPNYNGS